jgi:benzylsuccinate CoA-transferase BbsF subunit
VTYPDVAGANFGTFAVLAALERRDRTGEGTWLDLSHYEAGVATIAEGIIDYTMNGRIPARTGNRHPSRAPQGVYPCEGLDRWIAISAHNDAQFRKLAETLKLEGVAADPRFQTLEGRMRHHDELDRVIAAATAPMTAERLECSLQEAGVEATVVQTAKDIYLDPQLKHRGFFQAVPPHRTTPEVGPRPHPRTGWKMSVSSPSIKGRAPDFGEHTDEVLAEYLNLGQAEIAQLEADGVIARKPRDGMVAREPIDARESVASGRFVEVDEHYRERLDAQFRE